LINQKGFNPGLKQAFEHRLARYALAGSVLLVAPGAANAGVVYSGLVNLTVNPSQTLNLDLDGSGPDFQFSAGSAGIPSSLTASFFGINRFNNSLTPLAFGAPITLANTTSGGGTLMKSSSGPSYSGPWANTSAGYLGLKFTTSGQTHLGWADIAIDRGTPSLTLRSYAYNDVANASINAGEVPEPSSLALFAIGAAGVLALRRRRHQN
jgi:hypothetical protein